ncbi:MAG: ATPase [Clostridia bacterium]|nr:ATPase [Clostridia bacterium]
MDISTQIKEGKACLGIELGSTRIKAVLVCSDGTPIASGGFDWENRLENGVWTYHLDDVWTGIQAAYAKLAADVAKKYSLKLTAVAAVGFSAMMHGYLAFDKNGKQLAEFRTWRNTSTQAAAEKLTQLFSFNIPQRWSIAHLEQAVLNNEANVKDIAFLTTLAGYVHYKLSGKKVLGVGDASGMFPIDSDTCDYNDAMLKSYDKLCEQRGLPWRLRDILPKVLCAGEDAGVLTKEGAKLLDPTGTLAAGALMAPPEGDAGTGMAATNSVAAKTGNVSAGTSVFAMVVLDKPLSRVYPEIDIVTTPTGKQVAMVHCNNCTSDINAWAGMLVGFAKEVGKEISIYEVLDAMFYSAPNGSADCGGLVSYNYFSGEHITAFEAGRPLFARLPDAEFTFANFARAQLFSALATLKIGMDILLEKERVEITSLLGHGGFFKAKGVGQSLLAAAMDTPVSVMETAGEGGPWGMALLAAYRANKKGGESLEEYLASKIFADAKCESVQPSAIDAAGFNAYMKAYKAGLAIERAAVDSLA